MDPLRAGDPRQVGPYTLLARLPGGGMGQVFLGRSRGGRLVAVKLVRDELAADRGFRRRFALEVAAARRVGGFYTAQVVDADTDAEPPWLVTAYVSGPSLYDAVEEHGPLPAEAVTVLGAGLAEGLAGVHACELVHCDLKPGNVILAADGPRLIDFGIARALEATSTLTTEVIGTPGFMSPEQARGRTVGPASDVFSLGAVLAYAATGRGPFGGGPIEAVIYRVIHEEPDLGGVPAGLTGLVTSCLAKSPADRPAVPEILDRLATPAEAPTLWLPPDVTAMITRRTAEVRTLTATREAGGTVDLTARAEPSSPGGSPPPGLWAGPASVTFPIARGARLGSALLVCLVTLGLVVGASYGGANDAPEGSGRVEAVTAFFSMPAFFLAVLLVVGVLCLVQLLRGGDALTLDAEGITVVRKGWFPSEPQTFRARWDTLEKVAVTGPNEKPLLVAWFKKGHEPTATWAARYGSQPDATGRHVLCRLRSASPWSLARRTQLVRASLADLDAAPFNERRRSRRA